MPANAPAAALDPGPAVPPVPDRAIKRMVPWLVAVAFFMESLDTTILNTAVPTIAQALQVAPLSMKAVLASYALSLAMFIPISGWMADRFGTRRIFASAIATFTLGSLLCGLSRDIHFLVAFRILQGCGGAMMVPVGRIVLVRTFARSELVAAMTFVAIPGLVGPMLGPLLGGLIVSWAHWSLIFFVNIPIGLLGLHLVSRHLPDYRADDSPPLDVAGLVLFGSGISLLSYVLEVFGEHRLPAGPLLGLLALSLLLLAGYGLRAMTAAHPLLRLGLFRLRTFRLAVGGSLATRLGIGGVPFLLPLLYQVGLGFSPIQSGLLILPQVVSALSLKMVMPKILSRFGYRTVLVFNTALLGILIMLFATVGAGTPVWAIVVLALVLGFVTSLQYSSMNTLAYADVSDGMASSASSIASTVQQLSISFGIAAASLATACFVPDRFHASAPEMIHGIHQAFLVLGGATVVTALIFAALHPDDGDAVSRHTAAAPTP
jgi:EmrB/QacA subfamily drug resistance transporter